MLLFLNRIFQIDIVKHYFESLDMLYYKIFILFVHFLFPKIYILKIFFGSFIEFILVFKLDLIFRYFTKMLELLYLIVLLYEIEHNFKSCILYICKKIIAHAITLKYL